MNDLPAVPYPGIEPFTYAERKVFFARAAEARRLNRLITLYRGVLLYAPSGMGKSSLVNAGVIPLAIEEGHQPGRLRVQPRMNEEILAEPIRNGVNGISFLPSILAEDGRPAVLSVEAFLERLRARASEARPLLIFDQFEEWVTLFGRESACRSRVLDALCSLINDPQLPVKILIVLREDYLASLQPLFERCPSLPDHALRLTALGDEGLRRAIRGPFETYPQVYEPEIEPSLASGVLEQLKERSAEEGIPLTEVQIVCRILFKTGQQGKTPAHVFEEQGGVQGILERYLDGALDTLGTKLRDPAVALLNRMITSADTRNVISRDDLVERVALEDGFPRELLDDALDGLEQKTHLVCRELRRGVHFYEIVSEFLVSWIRKQGERLRLALAKRRLRRIAAGSFAVALALAGVAAFTGLQWRKADLQTQLRTAQLLAEKSGDAVSVPRALLLAVESTRRARLAGRDRFPEAEESLRRALAHSEGHVLGSYGRPVFDAAVSPEGRWLAGTGKGGVLYLWRPGQAGLGREPQVLAGYPGRLEAAAVSPDSRWVAAAGNERSLFLWRLAPKDAQPRLLLPKARIKTIFFGSGGRWLVAAGEDDVPWLWNLGTSPEGEGRSLVPRPCMSTRWSQSPSLRWIAVGCDDGTVLAWDLRGEKPQVWDLNSPSSSDEISALAFSSDESRLAAGRPDGTVQLWRLDGPVPPPPLRDLPREPSEVSGLAFHPEGRWLAVADAVSGVHLRSLESPPLHSHKPPAMTWGPRSALVWSNGGQWLLSRDAKGRWSLWSLAPSGRLVESASPGGLAAEIHSLGFVGEDRLFIRPTRGPAKLWNLGAGSMAFGDEPRVFRNPEALPPPEPPSGSSGNGWRIAVSGDSPILWDPQASRQPIDLRRRHEGGVSTWAFSGDGHWLVTGAGDGNAHLWSLTRVRRLVRAKREPDTVKICKHPGAVTVARFSPDGRWLLTLGATAFLWSAEETATCQELTGHPGRVTAGDISADSRWLATGDDRGKVRLWNLSRKSPQAVDLPGSGKQAAILRVGFDGAGVLALGKDGTVRRWRLSNDELLDLACRTAGRNLTQDEWNQLLPDEEYDGRTCPDFPP